MESDRIVTEAADGLFTVTLNRPDKLNAMTTELVQSLHRSLDELAVDPTCRVIVLTGAGRGFCAGLDLTGYGAAPHTEHMGPTPASFAVPPIALAAWSSYPAFTVPTTANSFAADVFR